MKKRMLSMLLAMAMCLSLLPTVALAEGEDTGSTTTPALGDKLTLEAVEGTEGFNGEGYGNLVDGKNTAENGTKWCLNFTLDGAYVILKAESAVKISGYSFTTGNDNARENGRNPKSWVLYGSDSQDGDWTEIAAVTDDTTMQDKNFTRFDFVLTAAPSAYQYYKFVFTANQGAKVMQLSEIALYGPVCEHEWQNEGNAVDVTCTENGYQLQKCSKCGSTKRVVIAPATGHEYNNGPECIKCGQVCCATLTTKDNAVSYYENLKDALDSAQNHEGCTVKLYSKATYDIDKQYICWGTFTIDLNGQQAAFRLRIADGSNITLINTADTQATFGDDSIEYPVVYAYGGTVTVGRSDGSDGDIRFQKQGGTWPSDETFFIDGYGNAFLYGGTYMKFSCNEKAKLYYYLPAGFAFANSDRNEVAATGNTLSDVHIVPHTQHQKDENGFCPICGACEHPTGEVSNDTFKCQLCGRTMLACVEQSSNNTYFSDLNDAIQKAAETGGCTLKLLANTGTLTVSKGAFNLDLNGKTVNSLTVSGGNIKLANAEKIGTLTVSGGVTLASLLPEGYAFYKSWHWYSADELAETTSLSDISVRQIPLKDLTVTADKESYVYGDDITLTASVTEVCEPWGIRYDLHENGESPEGCKSVAENSFKIEKPAAGKHTYTCVITTGDNYNLSQSITVTVGKKEITSPAADTTEFTYNGDAQTYNLAESADYTISDNVTQTQANKEGYTITVSLKDKANTVWADTDNDTENKIYQFIIGKAPVTVTASDKTAYVGGTAPDLSKPEKDKDYTISGLIGKDTLTGEVTLKYDPEKPDMTKTGDTAKIVAGGTLANDNYEVSYLPGKLTITTRPSSGGSSGGGSSGTKTETTKNPDGSTTKTETKSDGTVVETTTNPDGSTTKTETKKDGSSVTEIKAADGSTGTVKTDKNGSTETTVKISEKAAADAKKSGETVKVPAEVKAGENSNSAPTVKVELPKNAGETKVEIPVKNVSGGTVAVIVNPDGTEELVKDSVPTENGIQLTVSGDTTVKIVNNSKGFADIKGHWAEDSINFVSARGLVNGIDTAHYAPNAATTRAQLWTILARQNGADLTGGANWYEKAQAWSISNSISDGTNPSGTITRAQMVTMLWRTAGSAAAESKTGFTDVPADSYYSQAVAWAVERGITTGVGNSRFDPNATCTRAQIAAFLQHSYLK